jgi:hypothetical protein
MLSIAEHPGNLSHRRRGGSDLCGFDRPDIKAWEIWFIVMNCLDLGFDQSSAELPLKECALNRHVWVPLGIAECRPV